MTQQEIAKAGVEFQKKRARIATQPIELAEAMRLLEPIAAGKSVIVDQDWLNRIMFMAGIDVPAEIQMLKAKAGEGMDMLIAAATEEIPCQHEGWSFEKHGRCCPKCSAFMVDWGD